MKISKSLLLSIALLSAFPASTLNAQVANSGQTMAATKSSDDTKVIKPGANLVVEGIPPIPAEIAEATKKYTEAVPVGGGLWHPVRRELLVAKRVGNVAQAHLLSAPMGTPKQLTNFPDPVGSGSWQPKKGDYFIFFKATGGNEVSQLYRYDVATGTVTPLTTDPKKRIGGGPWSNAGDRYVYSAVAVGASNASETFKTEFYTINPADPASAKPLMTMDGVGWAVVDWTPDDKKLLIGQQVSANESYLYLYDIATGERTPLTPKEGDVKVSYGGARFAGDGRSLYLTTDKGSEFQRLVQMDLATRAITPITSHINWDIDGFSLTDDKKWLAFVANENGISKLHVLDTANNKEIKLPKIPEGLLGGFGWHPTTNELRLNITSYRTLTDVYSLDLKSGKLTHWAKTELNGYPTEGLREPELVKWKSFDGLEISGFLYRPPTTFKGKRPVIINIHGGPEGQSQPGPQGRNSYYINDLGVAVIYPNVRGSSGYGKTFLALDNGYKREDSVKDIGALLEWIAKQPDLDKDRVLVTGGSYGGYMTLAVATNYNDLICCSVDIVGISNFNTFMKNTEAYRRDLRRVEYGDEREPKMAEFFEKISPLNNASKITKPLFVIQGKNDPRVPYTEAEQIVAAARKNNTPVWFLMANDEGHGFGKKNNVDYQFYATIMFIREHLLK